MKTSISVICYKGKKLSNGEHPLMLRASKDGKRSLKSLGISVKQEFWDFKKNTPRKNCPNRDLIIQTINKSLLDFQTRIMRKEINEEEYTSASIIMESKKKKTIYVGDFMKKIVEELESSGNLGNSDAYDRTHKMIVKFYGQELNFRFGYITVSFCKKLENWFRKLGQKDTTISYYMRTLRATYYRAIEAGEADRDSNPFIEYKLSHLNTKTRKRALSKANLLKILNANCSEYSYMKLLAHHIFSFSYYCGGISFVDIANLTSLNIIDGRIIYSRQKTHGAINLKLLDKAANIIEYYAEQEKNSGYLFPIFDKNVHKTPKQKKERVHNMCRNINISLKEIAAELGIKDTVTTYVARHSFATSLKKSGINTGIISQALGHQSIKTTEIYLSEFDNEQVDEAMMKLI